MTITVIFVIVLAYMSMRPRSLLDLARPVVDCSNWYGPSFWISTREMAGPKQGDESGLTALAFDVETGAQRPLPELVAALNRVEAGCNRFSSPDGRWILIDHLNNKPYYDAVSTDGSRHVRWPKLESETSAGGNIPWFADSKRWVYIFSSSAGFTSNDGVKAVIRCLKDPTSRKEIPWPKPGNESGFEQIATGLHDDLVITSTIFAKRPSTIRVTWHKRDLIRGTLERLNLPAAGGEEVLSVAASPGGRRLAWLVWHKQSPKPKWLSRFLHLFRSSEKDCESLWITDEDGGHQREIGRVPVDVFTDSGHGFTTAMPNGPGELNWSPDGRRMSFQFEGRLWVMSI